MRSANLFLLLGTIGFLNVYEDLMGEDDTGKLELADAKRLQRKFGVKEKRSAERSRTSSRMDGSSSKTPQSELRDHFEDFSEELVEYLKRPVFRGLRNCKRARETACNCLKLVCFGQAECTLNVTAASRLLTAREGDGGGPVVNLQTEDPRYVYYVTSRRLRARQSQAPSGGETRDEAAAAPAAARQSKRQQQQQLQQFLRCRQTTINPYVLCECKKYTRLGP